MVRRVIWTPDACSSFQSNLDFLLKEWTEQVHDNFIRRVNDVVAKIAGNPQLYVCVDTEKKLYRCVVTNQVSLYYQIIGLDVYLITFWNNYQNPERLPKK